MTRLKVTLVVVIVVKIIVLICGKFARSVVYRTPSEGKGFGT
jgi:hypothetical protein